MAREIILATRNDGKLKEFNHAFGETAIRFVSLNQIDNAPEVEETCDTYEGNARLKARAIAEFTGMPTVADDSGIEIDALPCILGVKSARFANGRDYEEVNADILERLKTETNRKARYVAVLVYVNRMSDTERVATGICDGLIHDKTEGEGGFGFDPIFFVPEFGMTMANLSLDVKNKISHRARAIDKLKSVILQL